MIFGATLALLLPSLGAYLGLRRLWSNSEAALDRALAAAVAPALGIGFASCSYFLLLLLVREHPTAVRLDLAVWLITDGWLLALAKRDGEPQRTHQAAGATTNPVWKSAVAITGTGCLFLFALACCAFWLHWAANPHGEWDAWAIWNLRARALLRGVPDWPALFSPAIAWSNPDYPLLLPLTVACLWAYGGRESTVVPAVVAMLFFLSSVAVVVISVGSLRGWAVGLLSGMAVLMSRTYVFQSSCQCADVPIAFFVLVAICFVTIGHRETHPAPLLLTAGAAAGLAAWTKNEGMLLLGLVVLVSSFPARRFRTLAAVLAGAALPALTLAIFKLHLAPSNYLFGMQSFGAMAQKLTDVARWTTVIDRLEALGAAWGEVPGGALVGLGLVVALTAHPNRSSFGRATFGLALAATVFIGYGLVYVLTPLPLEWQIATSFDRLFTQLWPTLVWAAFQLSGSEPA